jgi:hypothetical protein
MANEMRGHKYTEEEFKNLAPKKQQEIIKARKARETRLAELDDTEMSDIMTSTVTESQLNAKFNKIFKTVRKGLLVLRAKKIKGSLVGTELIEATEKLFEDSLEL